MALASCPYLVRGVKICLQVLNKLRDDVSRYFTSSQKCLLTLVHKLHYLLWIINVLIHESYFRGLEINKQPLTTRLEQKEPWSILSIKTSLQRTKYHFMNFLNLDPFIKHWRATHYSIKCIPDSIVSSFLAVKWFFWKEIYWNFFVA